MEDPVARARLDAIRDHRADLDRTVEGAVAFQKASGERWVLRSEVESALVAVHGWSLDQANKLIREAAGLGRLEMQPGNHRIRVADDGWKPRDLFGDLSRGYIDEDNE